MNKCASIPARQFNDRSTCMTVEQLSTVGSGGLGDAFIHTGQEV